jgi:hypothetical protein
MMIKGNAIREIRFRDGHIIRKGDFLSLTWPDARNLPWQVDVTHGVRTLKSRARTALAWIGLEITTEQLSEAMNDGVCETPSGNSVEPDGIDHEGNPSWLMIHGIL